MPELLGIKRGEIHLWSLATFGLTPDWLGRHLGLLSSNERARHRRYVFEKDRNQFLIARALLRTTLSKYVSERPESWCFKTNELGKPEIDALQNPIRLRFNVSHSDRLVLCAVTVDNDIGVDCEQLDRQVDTVRLGSRVFSRQEREYIDELPQSKRRQSFFHFWTLKEAYVKARGQGMSLELKAVSFDISEPPGIRVTFGPDINDQAEDWQFVQPLVADEYAAAIAIRLPRYENLKLTLKTRV